MQWTATDVVRRVASEPDAAVFRAGAGGRIEEVCVSPSGRYAAVGVVRADAGIDEYPTRAEWLGRTSTVVEVASGDVLAEVSGTRPDWCA